MQYFIVPTLNPNVYLLTTSYYDAFNKCIFKGPYSLVLKSYSILIKRIQDV